VATLSVQSARCIAVATVLSAIACSTDTVVSSPVASEPVLILSDTSAGTSITVSAAIALAGGLVD
jgi:hypothetical protein